MGWLFEPGFFSNGPVHVALVIGGVTAVVSALVGVFTVVRGQSFGGHALSDVSTAGGSGALLIGLSPLSGFVAGDLLGGAAMEALGTEHERGRDVATGIVLGAATGLAALFLYLDATSGTTTGTAQQILFGSIFVLQPSIIPVVAALACLALGLLALLYRPLVLHTFSPEIAHARGVPVRLVGALYMAALAMAVALSSITIGTVLSTALLIGPPAAALRLTRGMGRALLVAALTGLGATWLGILLSYDSFYWSPSRRFLPVSFFVVAIIVVAYLASGLARLGLRRRPSAPGGA